VWALPISFSSVVQRSGIPLAAAAALASVSACREQTSAEQAVVSTGQAQAGTSQPHPPAVELEKHETEADKRIRQGVDAAIRQDPSLKDRPISFSVDNGDISVTGTVRTETERQRINELALHVAGVKSVANALRVSPGEGGN